MLVDVDDANLAHAATYEFWMNVREGPEIGDAASANFVDQLLDRAEVLDPERNGRMVKQAAGIGLAGRKAATSALAVGHILDRDEHPGPIVLEAGQDLAIQLDVQPTPRQS